jgi:hypothetical protein
MDWGTTEQALNGGVEGPCGGSCHGWQTALAPRYTIIMNDRFYAMNMTRRTTGAGSYQLLGRTDTHRRWMVAGLSSPSPASNCHQSSTITIDTLLKRMRSSLTPCFSSSDDVPQFPSRRQLFFRTDPLGSR